MIKKIIKKILGEKKYHSLAKRKASRRLAKYGDEALHKIDVISKEMSFEYWLMFGSLLGAYREHGFIKHDDDIDLGIMSVNITKELVDKMLAFGFSFTSVKITSDNKHRMASFKYHGIIIDFYGFSFDDKDDSIIHGFTSAPLEGNDYSESYRQNLFRVMLVTFKYNGIERVRFNNIEVPIPQNAATILEGLYGPSFMKPIKGAKPFKGSIVDILPISAASASMVSIDSL